MNVHQITLSGYTAFAGTDANCVSGLYLGTAGSYGVEQLDVVQSVGWENLSVTAIFQPCGVKITVPAEGGAIDVPWEATADALPYPQGRIVFQGYADGELINTCDIVYTVSGHSATAGTDPQPPTPDQYQQFVKEVQASAEAAANSATEAAGSASAAAGSASAASSSAQQAADTLQQVQEAGQQATEAIGTAQSAAIKAVGDAQSAAVQAVQGQQQTSVGAVQAAGTAAVDQVSQTGQQQVQAVKDEGTAQIGTVAEAGYAQVQAVQQAGAQQITDIGEAGAQQVQAGNTAGDAKLDEINTAIAHPPQPNTATGFWQVWNAEAGKYEDTTALYQGGYYTPSVAEDGTLTWTGSLAGMPELPSANIRGPQGLGVPTPSADNIGQVPTVNDTGDGYLLTGPYAPLEASIRPTANGNPAVCEDSVAWSFQGLKIYGKSVQDGTPSPENPVPIMSAGEGGSVELNVTGNNLFDVNSAKIENLYIAYSGIGYFAQNWSIVIPIIPNTAYTISEKNSNSIRVAVTAEYPQDGTEALYKTTELSYAVQHIPDNISQARFLLVMLYGNFAEKPDFSGLMVNYGITALPWQPYTGQSLLISTPSGLPGIPVTSGGNYTDSTGQQLTSDYWDFGDGQQHILCGEIASYNGEEITTPYISSTGALTTGAQVLYVLPEPRTEPISAEIMAAYRALTTYSGTTVVSTAEPVAGIEASYVMDGTAAYTKINGALAQLSAANTQTSQVVNTMLGASE